jgi:uncharacterized membrane protein
MVRKLILALFCLILASSFASAAVIQGSIYDLELNLLSGVKIEVDTTPRQVFVATTGSYSFALPEGRYTITATYPKDDLKVKEVLTIRDQGKYNLDLILFPDLDIEAEILDETDDMIVSDDYFEEDGNIVYRMIIAAVIILGIFVGIYFWFKSKSKQKQEPEDLDKILKFIKKEGGRSTQKDIRKQFPLSEAKVSLMIAELEDKDLIKKIKKGRGNIIVLKK